ncbi:hypothetical protein JRO89_XS06G0068600 [Xanthoceras sorbifolium]|uniref:SBP-type domain-containing protein n=1 Tax=Xanthoceras sorbifolium TaxID=99658 RepID=A0ABQ8HX19_9ROSI|nr:hypothetical protein JRO89_XS06G0068600 [Xanthoceras sorbifolium]
METSKTGGERSLKEAVVVEEEEEEEEDDEDAGGLGFGEDDKKKKLGKKGSSSAATPSCQVENCTADMSDAKRYHKRHKVCEFHAKASVVRLAGLQQRFCQQCSRLENPNSHSCSMKYQSLMKPKGVAGGVLLDTTSAAGKAQLSYTTEKAQTEKDINTYVFRASSV